MSNDQMGWVPNVRAALREQFPPLHKVITERPGSKSDRERQRRILEANQMAKTEDAIAAWQARMKERQRALDRERADAYRAYRAAKTPDAGSFLLEKK